MSSTTSGDLHLTKPAYTDPADIADINANMDAIDTAVSDLNSKTLKPITVSVDSLTNASGSYNHTTSNLTLVTEDMKAIDIEVGTPETFKAPVTVTTGNHTINISCPSVSGSSTVKVTLIHTQPVEGGQNVPSSITSTEFDILAGRIGTLSALQTSVKTDTVSAINSLSEQIGTLNTVTQGTYSPTPPTDCSVYNDGCFYIRYGKIVEFHISFKMENVTQTGYAGRNAITLNMLYANRARTDVQFFASDGLGDSKPVECQIHNDILTIFPATTGTTYAIGCVTYVANE